MPGVLKSLFLAAIATALATGVTAQDTQEDECLDVEYVVQVGNYKQCCSNGNYKKHPDRVEVCREARRKRR
eukprot:CAMPEP_0195528590 /NCGR_PEP_ID=MMETSP0794_2-20130614/30784_1 /TAXON_ID=515487 /ORGANISM="Stephanopyxis turris, Strain CCMP 815" /LENGTH=70 /DNA_ID=CAMNT_0040659749 /DNA_START=98 /DNA_END=306 /DNA_ORIENTATION=+